MPSRTAATASTTPIAVSIRTVVTGSTMGTRPDSSIAVTAHMVLLPDIGVKPACSSTIIPKSEPALTAGRMKTAQSPG